MPLGMGGRQGIEDRQLRLIECKWATSVELIKTAIQELPVKAKMLETNESYMLVLVVSAPLTKTLQELAQQHQVVLVSLTDFFE